MPATFIATQFCPDIPDIPLELWGFGTIDRLALTDPYPDCILVDRHEWFIAKCAKPLSPFGLRMDRLNPTWIQAHLPLPLFIEINSCEESTLKNDPSAALSCILLQNALSTDKLISFNLLLR
jgi:hypothetical protein